MPFRSLATMKFSFASVLALSATASAHTIFYEVSVNGVAKAAYSGVRAQTSNNPYKDVTASDFACGSNLKTSTDVISVVAGDKIGTYWQHVPGMSWFPSYDGGGFSALWTRISY